MKVYLCEVIFIRSLIFYSILFTYCIFYLFFVLYLIIKFAPFVVDLIYFFKNRGDFHD